MTEETILPNRLLSVNHCHHHHHNHHSDNNKRQQYQKRIQLLTSKLKNDDDKNNNSNNQRNNVKIKKLSFLVPVAMIVLLNIWNITLRSRYLQTVFLISTKAMGSSLRTVDDNIDPTVTHLLHLRYDYTNLERLSVFAQLLERTQGNCSKTTLGIVNFRDFAGLGSDLHMYSIAFCKALERGSNIRLRSIGPWHYRDTQACATSILSVNGTTTIDVDNNIPSHPDSPMSCYFPQSEPHCPDDDNQHRNKRISITKADGKLGVNCPNIKAMYGTSTIRAATTEFLFTRLSPIVIQEAERQLNLVFGHNNFMNKNSTITSPKTASSTVPNKLITVHVRWGDKTREMELVTIDDYVNAVQRILDQRRTKQQQQMQRSSMETTDVQSTRSLQLTNNMSIHHNSNAVVDMYRDYDTDEDVHILLACEDPAAVDEFMEKKPNHWNVYLDQYYVEMLPYRMSFGNVDGVHVKYSETFQGRNGLIALGSLLVAMEANDYVLTTASNWSRLMNEIRKNIINPRCSNCTTMIDLRPGEY